jgi:hypothetical protein
MEHLLAKIIAIPRPHIRVPRVQLRILMQRDTQQEGAHLVVQP